MAHKNDYQIQKQLDKPQTWFCKYYPARIRNVGEKEIADRQLVFDFKDGRAYEEVAQRTAENMLTLYGKGCVNIVFAPVPASTSESNELRYKAFCHRVCELTGAENGYEHYMGNMLLILLVGPGLEEKYGSGTMVWTIAVTALVTGLVHFVFFPGSVLLGASGVVFMMIVLSSFTAMRRGEIPITLILVVIFYLGGEIMDGLFKQDNISQITHIVGGLCGLVFGFTIRRGRR